MTTQTSSTVNTAVLALQCLGTRDFDGLRALLAPQVQLDWPYHHSGAPVLLQGVDAFIEAINTLKVFHTFELNLVDVIEQPGTSHTIIEARSLGTYIGGKPDYTNHYLFILAVEAGKVTHWREFYNPLAVLKLRNARND